MPTLWFSVSATTRLPRPGEIDGVNYHFVTPEKFDELVANKQMLEWAVVHGLAKYRTPRRPVERSLREHTVLLRSRSCWCTPGQRVDARSHPNLPRAAVVGGTRPASRGAARNRKPNSGVVWRLRRWSSPRKTSSTSWSSITQWRKPPRTLHQDYGCRALKFKVDALIQGAKVVERQTCSEPPPILRNHFAGNR